MNQGAGYLVILQENNCTFTKLLLLNFPLVCSSGDYFKLCIHDCCTLFNSPAFFTLRLFSFKKKYFFLTSSEKKMGVPFAQQFLKFGLA